VTLATHPHLAPRLKKGGAIHLLLLWAFMGCSRMTFSFNNTTTTTTTTTNNNNNVLKSVQTSQGGKVTILWNQQVQTDRTILNNKTDIIIRDNEKGTCMLIEAAISGDRNVIKKEAEKILKYKDLYSRNTAHVECKNKGDTSNNRGD